MRKLALLFAICANNTVSIAQNADEINKQEFQEMKKIAEAAGLIADCFNKKYPNACQVAIKNIEEMGYSPEKCNNRFCEGVAMLYQEAGDYYISNKYNEVLCHKYNRGDACLDLGFNINSGKGARQNYSLAKQYFGKACDLGVQGGCDAYRLLHSNGVK